VDDRELERRALRHAALGDPVRLAIVDELTRSDRSPVELMALTGIASNLLAHHLDTLESAGLIKRNRSSGDGRRRYVHLERIVVGDLAEWPRLPAQPALFVCTANAARSQLAAGLWRQLTGAPAASAGTQPAPRVHPKAVAAGRRLGIDLSGASPTNIDDVKELPPLVVTVCDRAHEELDAGDDWLHWSIPDPAEVGTRVAFDRAGRALVDRIRSLVATPP
jgi:protein-tyrosine-phosphatase/DNA-binding HxlR family transcriptional regulator